ncbi:MAG: hypothetical protein IJB93_03640, partial [Clostridia bacterium]|nr:hypothetical protein [Clostridia bacterium]
DDTLTQATATQDDIDDATTRLNQIIEGINDGSLRDPDYSAVEDKIDEAKGNDNLNKDTQDKIKEIEDALAAIKGKTEPEANAKDDQDDVKALEDQLDEILKDIEDGTAIKPDYSEAEKAIQDAENIDGISDADKAIVDELKEQLEAIKNNPESNKTEHQDDVDDIKDAALELVVKYENICRHNGTTKQYITNIMDDNKQNTHSVKCVDCGEIIKTEKCEFKTETVAATCCTDGYTVYTCKLCGYSFKADIVAADENLHKFGRWYDNEASCKEIRTQTRYCDNPGCFVSETVTVLENGKPAYGAHYYVVVPGRDATCTTDGHTPYYRCVTCDEVTESERLPAKGHTDGDKNGNCDRCGYIINHQGSCKCFCHNDAFFVRIFFKIVNFFWKLFKINANCECGSVHW